MKIYNRWKGMKKSAKIGLVGSAVYAATSLALPAFANVDSVKPVNLEQVTTSQQTKNIYEIKLAEYTGDKKLTSPEIEELDKLLAQYLELRKNKSVIKSENPEIFNRRHMKLGIRLADLGKKIKDNIEVARRVREILIDIRNERTPQWSHSAYYVAFYFMVGVANSSLEFSSYNSLGIIWDGCNADERYGMESCIYNYEPLPPILNMMFKLERPLWLDRLTTALTGGLLYLNHFERETLESMKKRSYGIYDTYIRYFSWRLNQGIVLPSQSVQAVPPKYNKETGQWERMGFEYPKGPRIHHEDLELGFADMMNGVLLDINHKSKVEKVTRDDVISIGHGLQTQYLRPEKE